jgi:hypothetical protein
MAWVAEAWINSDGGHALPEHRDAVWIFAVSVHEKYPTQEKHRIQLIRDVIARFRPRVPSKCRSLWVFPGGYFGFDAQRFEWPGFNIKYVERQIPNVLKSLPRNATLVFGADNKGGEKEAQHAWICHFPNKIARITRSQTDLSKRKIKIGPVAAAFFICGEFTGSWTAANGPYFENCVLRYPAKQLADCRLLVDLAHYRVPGSVNGTPSPRWVHEIQMNKWALHGTAVLTHHHGEGPRFDCQSNWIQYRGGKWLDSENVREVHYSPASQVTKQ